MTPAFCPNCGTRLVGGTCPACGTVVVPKAENTNNTETHTRINLANEQKFTQPVQIPVTKQTIPVAPPTVQSQPSAKSQPQARPAVITNPKVTKKKPTGQKSKKGLLIGLITGGVALVVAAVIVCLTLFIPSKSGGNEAKIKDYAYYIKNNNLYYTNFKSEPLKITNSGFTGEDYAVYNYSYFVTYSEDGKTVLYPDGIDLNQKYTDSDFNGYDLYIRKLNEEKPDKIASNVMQYTISPDASKVLYLRNQNLYLYENGDANKIANDVIEYSVFEKDLSRFAYSTESDYYVYENSKITKYFSSHESVSYSNDYSQFAFLDANRKLYLVSNNGTDKKEIDTDVERIAAVSNDGLVYYVKSREVTAKIYDCITDDLLKSDKKAKKPTKPTAPTAPTAPDIEDYYFEDYFYDDYWEEYVTESDYDYDAYDAAYDAYYEEYEAYDAKYDEYEEKLAKYQDKLQDYEKISDRNKIREDLKEETYERTHYDLYSFDGTEAKLFTKNIGYSYVPVHVNDGDDLIFSFSYYEYSFNKSIKFSDIIDEFTYSYDITLAPGDISQIKIKLDSDVTEKHLGDYVCINGTFTKLQHQIYEYVFNDNATKCTYIVLDEASQKLVDGSEDEAPETLTYDLYEAKISNNTPGTAKIVKAGITSDAEDIYDLCYAQGNKLLYRNGGDLYLGDELIANEANHAFYRKNDKAVYYFTNIENDPDFLATLNMYKDGENTEIDDNISDYVILDGYGIAYIVDRYKMNLYKDGESKEIDRNARYLLSGGNGIFDDYSGYAYY